jgi:hypothetical protein
VLVGCRSTACIKQPCLRVQLCLDACITCKPHSPPRSTLPCPQEALQPTHHPTPGCLDLDFDPAHPHLCWHKLGVDDAVTQQLQGSRYTRLHGRAGVGKDISTIEQIKYKPQGAVRPTACVDAPSRVPGCTALYMPRPGWPGSCPHAENSCCQCKDYPRLLSPPDLTLRQSIVYDICSRDALAAMLPPRRSTSCTRSAQQQSMTKGTAGGCRSSATHGSCTTATALHHGAGDRLAPDICLLREACKPGGEACMYPCGV